MGSLLLALIALPVVAPAQAARVLVEGGTFRPLYSQPGETLVTVAPFRLDARPVTRAEFERFVRAHPRWRRDSVPALFADAGYLRDWPGPADAGTQVDRAAPVTNVSWFAARAYCAAQGGRLPATNEWEYAARADERNRDAAGSAAFRQRALELALARTVPPTQAVFRDVRGISGLHGGIVEWVSDFQSIFAGADSRETSRLDRGLTCAAGVTATGGSSDYAAFLRYAYRAALDGSSTTTGLGFRCASSQ